MNSVTASVSADRPRPAVRSRRTAVTFDSAGGLRLGGIAQFSTAVTDFADLARDPEAVIVGGRIWSPANLVAAVVGELRAVEPGASEAGVVTTYPAVYSDKQVALLRQALDLSGAGDVLLVPEPVAAAEWLEHEYGPLETGFVLIYDLGGTSLDVSIVRVGPDWDNHPMIGKPVRSYDFGGRPLGSMIARYAPEVKPGSARLSMTSIVDIDGLRTAHVQDSLQLVRACVRESGVSLSDIGCILLVGGASRPAEVARTLAELGRPVLISADPGQATAAGAALMAARTMALGASDGRSTAPRVAVFSSAAVVSAVAMSAVTVFGGPTVPELSPLLERLPELGVPTDSLLVDVGNEQLAVAWSAMSATTSNSGRALLAQRTSAYTRFITPAARGAGYGPSVAESRLGSHRDPRNCCAPGGLRYRGYGDPAYFVNPLPFAPVVRPAPGDIGQPPVPATPGQPGQPGQVPGQPPAPGAGSPPGGSSVPAPQNGSTPAETGPASGGSTPGSPSTGTSDAPGTGTGSDEHGGSGSNSSSSAGTSTGGSSSGGTASSSGSTSDSSANGSSGGSSGGSPGASSSGGSAGDSSTHGSSSAGDSSSGGPSSAGSAGNSSSGGPSSGGSAGNSSAHGSSSGGSAGNSSSDGSTSAGSAGNSASGGSAGNSSAHGSSNGGSAGNSSAGGSPSTGGSSSGHPGGASSAGGHSTGNSSGASSSGGSRGRSGSVGGSSGGSSAGGAGGAGGGGARGR
ncbi:Hsp70 family protein [Nocardia gamkensis]|uniref:Hsp70 family protein n=1 Tax=Nocardia gamkensis TaxID=352869 RepID=A0A7X6L3G1_9NOCA|nr:Hsp70 family protein [Nocardia gamkensis]NKY27080.1 Hsp70 family protein [Nocardia gamkensis]